MSSATVVAAAVFLRIFRIGTRILPLLCKGATSGIRYDKS
jgi:hypothetical protein